MINWYPLLAVLIASLTCAFLRSGLRTWTIAGSPLSNWATTCTR